MALLITDQIFENVVPIVEKAEDGKVKSLFIEGIFLQGEKKNRNGRIYPMEILDREVNRYINEYVVKNRALGELNHPEKPTVNPERASHLITKLWKEVCNWHGKAKILSTPIGNLVSGLINDGVQLGVSSRGLGSLKEGREGKIVQSDYFLCCVDIVSDPSAHEAWVNGVYEGKEWSFPNESDRDKLMREIDEHVRKTRKIDERFLLEKMQKFIKTL